MKTYFVSDTHLGCLAFPNNRENELKLVRWMDSIKADCEALYLMGDMIDFWYEYKYVVPKGFVRFFGKLAEFTDSGIPVYWFTGNHDIWLYSYVQQELGVTVVTDILETTLHGKKVVLAHGDGLGDPSLSFRILRSIFHNKVCQRLFSTIHPYFAMGFGLNWAKHSRLKRGPGPEVYMGEDREHLVQYAKQDLLKRGNDAPDFYIFGHRHILLDLSLSTKSRIIILGEWFYHYSYGVLDDNGFDLLTFEESQHLPA